MANVSAIKGGRVGLSETSVVRREFSLSSASSSRINFVADYHISKSSSAVREKRVSIPGLKNSVYIQLIILPVEFNVALIRPLIPARVISFAPTLGSTSSLVFIVHSWLGVKRTRSIWLFKTFCLRDNNKLQAAGGFFWELIVISSTRSFAVRITESGPAS